MVPADSHKISRVPCYSGVDSNKIINFRLQDYHLLRLDFPDHSTNIRFFDLPSLLQQTLNRSPSNTGHEKSCVNLPGPSGKAKYSHVTDSELVP